VPFSVLSEAGLPSINISSSDCGAVYHKSMRFKLPIFLAILLLPLLLLSFRPSTSEAALCGDYFDCNAKINETKQKIAELSSQADSLAKQISYLSYQIQLSQLEIEAAEAEIQVLSVDIDDLTQRLDRIASSLETQEQVFIKRARSAYISDRLSSFDIALGSESLDDMLHRIKYLRVFENQDKEVLEQMQDTREEYNTQKTALEGKKTDVETLRAQVEAHKISLANQQASKEQLLAVTRGEEAQYQQLLNQLQAELQSILAALKAGGTVIGEVSRGQRIARQGNTGCTTWPGGYHIHYAVGRGPVGSSQIDYFVNPCGFVSVTGGACYSPYWVNWWGAVVSGSYYSPGGSSNYLTQSAWASHMALDVVSRSEYDGSYYGVYASEAGTAYLVKDTTWGSWCMTGKPYNGPAYGIVIDHHNGYKTLYWHIQP